MKICVTGYDGRLGSELVALGAVPLYCDITKEEEIAKAVSSASPDLIINCAAFTNVDACENVQRAFNDALKVNFWGIEYLKRNFPGKIIHISTDYVFDGKHGPYGETTNLSFITPSVNGYGMTKFGGDIAFLNPHRRGDLLIRTTGLYGRTKHHDFVKLVRNSLSDGASLKVSKNLHGNQTYIPHLAEALMNIVSRIGEFSGIHILNVASQEVITRYEFALMIASVFGLDKSLLIPVTNAQVPGWVAERPTKGGLKVGSARKMKVPIYKILDGLKALHGENTAT